jgi:hypothetical protein
MHFKKHYSFKFGVFVTQFVYSTEKHHEKEQKNLALKTVLNNNMHTIVQLEKKIFLNFELFLE